MPTIAATGGQVLDLLIAGALASILGSGTFGLPHNGVASASASAILIAVRQGAERALAGHKGVILAVLLVAATL